MSIKVMTHVWATSRLKGSSLLLLLAIADHAHDNGRGAWPSVDTLATKIRMSKRNTQYLIDKVAATNELIVSYNTGPRGCNEYVIPVPWVDETPQQTRVVASGAKFAGVQSLQGVQSLHGGVQRLQGGVQPIAPEPSLTVKEPSLRGKPQTPAPKGAKPKAAKPKHAPETRLPYDAPPPDWVAYCNRERPELDPLQVFVDFAIWANAPGAEIYKRSWLATWQRWVRNERVKPLNRAKPAQRSANAGAQGRQALQTRWGQLKAEGKHDEAAELMKQIRKT